MTRLWLRSHPTIDTATKNLWVGLVVSINFARKHHLLSPVSLAITSPCNHADIINVTGIYELQYPPISLVSLAMEFREGLQQI